MQVLAVYAIATVFLANQGPVLMALGHTRLLSNLYGFGLLLKLPLLIWAAGSGSLTLVALVIAGVHLTLFAVSIVFTLRTIQLSPILLLVNCWHTMAAVAFMALAVLWLQSALAQAVAPMWLQLLAGVATGALVYSFSIMVLWYFDRRHASGETMVINFILARFNRGADATVA
jgi:O-antigen/teichoic acid export membrane protein